MTKKPEESIDDIINKKFGSNTIHPMKHSNSVKIDVIPTPSLALDYAIGVGGIPMGRMTYLYSWEGGGKTTIALGIAANAQKKGIKVAYIDMEHALDMNYAEALGVDTEKMSLIQPDSAEQVINIADLLFHDGTYQYIVVDSIASMVPMAEIEADAEQGGIGQQARLVGRFCRKMPAPIAKNNIAVLFINQYRTKVQTGYVAPGAPTEVLPGGVAPKFTSSLSIKLSATGMIKKGDNVIGRKIKARIEKNKLGSPFTTAEFDLVFGGGVSKGYELVDLGVATGVISKSGAFFYIGEEKIGHGRDAAKEFLDENIDYSLSVEKLIRDSFDRKSIRIEPVPSEIDFDDPYLQPEE